MYPERQNLGHKRSSQNMLLLIKCAVNVQKQSKPTEMYTSAFLET